MKKLLFFLLFLFMVSCVFGQDYSLTVESQYGFKFYGDYSGVVYAPSYTIGPYSGPFTVTLAPLNNYRWTRCDNSLFRNGTATWEYNLKTWTIDGTTYTTTTQAVTVDAQHPAAMAAAAWPLYVHGDGSTDNYAAWLCNPAITVFENEVFSSTVFMRGGDVHTLYEINLKYNPAIIQLNTVTPNNTSIVIDHTTPGTIRFTGSGSGMAANAASITWQALKAGNSGLAFELVKFEDDNGDPVVINDMTPRPYGTSAIVRKNFRMFGDIDADNAVNITDALMTARHATGLTPATYDLQVADVNLDGSCNIVDALIIARYSVGLIASLPVI